MKLFLPLLFVSAIYGRNIPELDIYLGMTSVSYTEVDSGLEGPNAREASSGTASMLSSQIMYHLYKVYSWSFAAGFTAPLFVAQGVAYYSVNTTAEYYFNTTPHYYKQKNTEFSVAHRPSFRYFANIDLSTNYLTYTTIDAKRSDVTVSLGGGGGLSYLLSENWSLKAKLSITKDVGVNTDAFAIKFFGGGTYFLDI